MKRAATIRHGHFVQPFDWASAQQAHGGEPFFAIALAYRDLLGVSDAVLAKSEALNRDDGLTAVGRQRQMKAWFGEEAAPTVKRGRAALKAAETAIEALRSKMIAGSVDKTDVAAAVLRTEMRTWLRGMDPSLLAARIRVGDLPPEAVAAVIEAPAELSGISVDQKARLEATALQSRFPQETAAIEAIEQAAEALISAERAATRTVGKAAQLGESEIAEALGEPVLPASMQARAAYFAEKYGLPANAEAARHQDDKAA